MNEWKELYRRICGIVIIRVFLPTPDNRINHKQGSVNNKKKVILFGPLALSGHYYVESTLVGIPLDSSPC